MDLSFNLSELEHASEESFASFHSRSLANTWPTNLVVAMSVCSATAFIAIVMATILRFILVRLNKKLDRGEHVEGAINSGMGVPGEAAERGFRFLT
jgi:ABC-type spermidine/putrescine transport system permease subunit II